MIEYEKQIAELRREREGLDRRIRELEVENARLRSLLPGPEVREMIKWYVDGDLSGEIAPKFAYHRCFAALAWLDELEAAGELEGEASNGD